MGIKITISKEDEPMGTAGPIALAKSILLGEGTSSSTTPATANGTASASSGGQPFFMLNSDVICEYPLKEMMEFHVRSKAEGTILVTKVEDPR